MFRVWTAEPEIYTSGNLKVLWGPEVEVRSNHGSVLCFVLFRFVFSNVFTDRLANVWPRLRQHPIFSTRPD